ncbi:hypothetical protein [Pseudobdellovibrio exovorus]|uniref:Histidine kinase/HSP90-like ATPase domain-containing protein n=1 Tax=Pseudobdellovibrio exovorus JSS TaxID=1184267 RepID=M4VF08_9BACT|nr:hypothetical protein [Pseudobdellovibrio exovorus]AGH96626.1 hypothetical protein A11Q_2410 [Pseudobdellovibrio exovorus JSS]
MSKEWVIKRKEVARATFGKLHNPQKIRELDEQLEEVCLRAGDDNLVQKLCRKIIEEVVNIMQHNDSWNEIAVQSKFNDSGSNFKFRIQYDGGQYYDPIEKGLENVVGRSVDQFQEYLRSKTIEDGLVTIKLQIKI